MSGLLTNLFGTIAGNGWNAPANVHFIPKDGAGKTVKIKGDTAKWLGLQTPIMQKYAYEYCYPVASVCDRLAELDLTGRVEITRYKGKGKQDLATNDWANNMRRLLKQPNPLQSWEQFRGQQVVYKKVFGYCPVLPIVPIGFEKQPWMATMIINLPPWCFDVEPTGKFMQSKLSEMIKTYKVTILGKTVEYTSDQVFILEDSFMQDEAKSFLLPKSRLCGLDMAVSNICAAMEADNVLLRKKGPLGFVSPDAQATKDALGGNMPMEPKEKQEVQDDLLNYGLSWDQYQYVVTRSAMKWVEMSYTVKELQTKETVVAGEQAICHRYAYPYVLYEQTGTTFANGENAQSNVYQDNVIPNNQKDLEKYNKVFQARENNCEITADFMYLSCLQEDELQKAKAAVEVDKALEIEWKNNLITLNQWRVARGYETTTDGDIYYKDTAGKEAKLEPNKDEDEVEEETTTKAA